MRNDFNEHHMTQVPITENQLGTMGMMSQVAEHVGMDYPEVPDYRYVAQPVNDFLVSWEEEGSVENPITIDEDEGFSEPRTPVSEQPSETPETRPVLRSIEKLQNSSAAPQLFDL